MTCTHTVIKKVLHHYYDDWTDSTETEVISETVSTFEDIDLHRMKCRQCGKVEYYSTRARDFYENGIENETYGLTTFNLIKYNGFIKGI